MEGIIRHARTVSPEMDIVMLHFIYDPFIPLLDKGIQPQVIMNHESVANHYYVSSINLAEEVAQRMRDGEFDGKNLVAHILHGTVIHIMLPLLTVSSTLNGVVTWRRKPSGHMRCRKNR